MGSYYKKKGKVFLGLEIFVISNTPMPDLLPDNQIEFWKDKEFLHPFPLSTSKQYIWKKGLVGSAGFHINEAQNISKKFNPPGTIIPLDSITGKGSVTMKI